MAKLDTSSFRSITIERELYGEDKGRLKGFVRTNNYSSALEVALPEDVALDVLRLSQKYINEAIKEVLEEIAAKGESFLLESEAEEVKNIPPPPITHDDEMPF